MREMRRDGERGGVGWERESEESERERKTEKQAELPHATVAKQLSWRL